MCLRNKVSRHGLPRGTPRTNTISGAGGMQTEMTRMTFNSVGCQLHLASDLASN